MVLQLESWIWQKTGRHSRQCTLNHNSATDCSVQLILVLRKTRRRMSVGRYTTTHCVATADHHITCQPTFFVLAHHVMSSARWLLPTSQHGDHLTQFGWEATTRAQKRPSPTNAAAFRLLFALSWFKSHHVLFTPPPRHRLSFHHGYHLPGKQTSLPTMASGQSGKQPERELQPNAVKAKHNPDIRHLANHRDPSIPFH